MDSSVPDDEEVHTKVHTKEVGPPIDDDNEGDGCDDANDYYGYDDTSDHDELASAEPSSRSLPEPMGQKHGRRTNVTAEVAPRDVAYFRPNRVLLYSPPRQRQKWGDTQVLPRINWGDLFFDLFYVGAAYNVSTILLESPNRRGLLYAAGTFLPVLDIWNQKTMYDARYVTEADIFHRVLVMIGLAISGIAISNIRPVAILADASNESSMFVFTLMLVSERILSSFLYLEVYSCGIGQKQLKLASRRDGWSHNISFPFYLAAMTIAAIEYFGDVSSIHYTFGNNTTNRRFLASATAISPELESDGTTDIPIFLCLLGTIIHALSFTFTVIYCFPAGGRHKEMYVFKIVLFDIVYDENSNRIATFVFPTVLYL
jgi:Bacterial low temperature requirement A protein (LtrA)